MVGFPAWAIENQDLVKRTQRRVRRNWVAPMATNAFYGTAIRPPWKTSTVFTTSRRSWPSSRIESEWPLFLAFELVTACCEERWQDALSWQDKLTALAVHRDGEALYPELYQVAADRVEAERRQPGSQPREANSNLPLIWTQSLAWLGDMLLEGLITPEDLDPCERRHPMALGADSVLVAYAAETADVQQALIDAGLPLDSGDAITIQPSDALAAQWSCIGANPKLGLSGKPLRRIETEDTARLNRQGQQTLAVTTAVLEDGISNLADDPLQLEDSVVDELHLLRRHWRGPGLPLLLIPVSAESFQDHPEVFLQLGHKLLSGRIGDIPAFRPAETTGQPGPLGEPARGARCHRTDEPPTLSIRSAPGRHRPARSHRGRRTGARRNRCRRPAKQVVEQPVPA